MNMYMSSRMTIKSLIANFPEILTTEQKQNIRYKSSKVNIFPHYSNRNHEPQHIGVFELIQDEEFEVWECKICHQIEAIDD